MIVEMRARTTKLSLFLLLVNVSRSSTIPTKFSTKSSTKSSTKLEDIEETLLNSETLTKDAENTDNIRSTRHMSKDDSVRILQDAADDDDNGGNDDDIDDLHVNYLSACIMPFHSYQPSETNQYRIPYGDVRITFDGGMGIFNNLTNGEYPGYNDQLEFTFEYDLQGLPGLCEKCRIQVTGGSDCFKPGIRYWDRSVEGAYNPWREEYGAIYTSNKHGIARGYFSMFDGFNFDQHKSRTVVVFDRDASTRIGCGVVRRKGFGECNMLLNTTSPTSSPVIHTVTPEMFPSSSPSQTSSPATNGPTVVHTSQPTPNTVHPSSKHTPSPSRHTQSPSSKHTPQPSLYTPPPSSGTPTSSPIIPTVGPRRPSPPLPSQHPSYSPTKTETNKPSWHYDKTPAPSRKPYIPPLFTPRPTPGPTEKKSKKSSKSKKRMRLL